MSPKVDKEMKRCIAAMKKLQRSLKDPEKARRVDEFLKTHKLAITATKN